LSGPLSDPEFLAGLRPVPSGLVGQPIPWPAVDLEGVSPDGAPVRIPLDNVSGSLLLAFLATRCDGCETFWVGLGGGGPLGVVRSVEVVVVTKSPASVDPAEVARLASGLGSVPVVMSDTVWAEYRVSGYPFFVLVDPVGRRVVGETVAFGMEDVQALLRAGGLTSGAAGGTEPLEPEG
jgi:hypothetical protein